jgi:hypothetical protein
MWAKRLKEATVVAKRFEELFDFDPMVQAGQACMEGRADDVDAIIDRTAVTTSL